MVHIHMHVNDNVDRGLFTLTRNQITTTKAKQNNNIRTLGLDH